MTEHIVDKIISNYQTKKIFYIGEKVTVIATDPSTMRDIPKFCHFLGHELLESITEDNEFLFIILKAETSTSS